jgi:hypothetical protein
MRTDIPRLGSGQVSVCATGLCNHFGAGDLAGDVHERVDFLEERDGVRQVGVAGESFGVCPAGMDVKEAGVADGAEEMEVEAAGLGARGGQDFAEGFFDGVFVAFAGVQFYEDELVHRFLPGESGRSMLRPYERDSIQAGGRGNGSILLTTG